MSEAGAVTCGQVISPTDTELPATHSVDVTEWMRAAVVRDQAALHQALPSRG